MKSAISLFVVALSLFVLGSARAESWADFQLSLSSGHSNIPVTGVGTAPSYEGGYSAQGNYSSPGSSALYSSYGGMSGKLLGSGEHPGGQGSISGTLNVGMSVVQTPTNLSVNTSSGTGAYASSIGGVTASSIGGATSVVNAMMQPVTITVPVQVPVVIHEIVGQHH